MLTAILLTAAASSLLWWRTAEATSRQLASTINEQIVAAVRKEVSAIVGEARAAHTAIRTLFLQNVLDTREADKREFVFLSQLQSQATISWVAFGWPDGSFFAAHKLGDGHLEMMEISLTDHPGQRRIDEYAVIPGDIEFETRQIRADRFPCQSTRPGSRPAWGPRGRNGSGSWTIRSGNARRSRLPARSTSIRSARASLPIIIEYTRLAHFLAQLEVGRTGTAFIFDGSGELIAAPDKDADELHPARSQESMLPLARMVLAQAGDEGRKEAWRRRLTSQGEAYEVALTPLPFPGWSLATVIPEAEFLGPVETTLRRLIIGLAAGALLAALLSAMLARSVIAAPLARVVGEIRHVESFALDQVRRHPSRLAEIASLSGAIAEMAAGLSAFRKFIPADLVRSLLRQGVEAKPGGSIQELTVMFIDVAGFTGLSERMGDRVVPLLSGYLDLASEIIVANGGTIDKFIGDAVMAFWGAPTRAAGSRRALLPRGACLPRGDRERRAGRRPGPAAADPDRDQFRPHAGRQYRLRIAAELHGDRRRRERGEPAGRRQQAIRHADPDRRGDEAPHRGCLPHPRDRQHRGLRPDGGTGGLRVDRFNAGQQAILTRYGSPTTKRGYSNIASGTSLGAIRCFEAVLRQRHS